MVRSTQKGYKMSHLKKYKVKKYLVERHRGCRGFTVCQSFYISGSYVFQIITLLHEASASRPSCSMVTDNNPCQSLVCGSHKFKIEPRVRIVEYSYKLPCRTLLFF